MNAIEDWVDTRHTPAAWMSCRSNVIMAPFEWALACQLPPLVESPITPEEALQAKRLLTTTLDDLATLPMREQKVLRMRFGIGEEGRTLKEVGQFYGRSRERIRMIEAEGLRKLRQLRRTREIAERRAAGDMAHLPSANLRAIPPPPDVAPVDVAIALRRQRHERKAKLAAATLVRQAVAVRAFLRNNVDNLDRYERYLGHSLAALTIEEAAELVAVFGP